MSQRTPSADEQIVRSIQFVAVVRIVYGVVAIFLPRVWPKFFRLDPDDEDARLWNAFLGSRDIAIGVHSLAVAKDPSRQRDVILINQLSEVGDSILVGQEIRHGRSPKSFVTVAAFVFNGVMHAIWLRVHLLRRR
ncbi:hypothetical protein DSM112329_02290 [Paraconexibacter sp. AEG42_29]|uniref:Uncharacterized protein n=1 Tax=Paraconexibacter sp. AEG42_29 TaxID=2997339 RepID=A0AAU7AVQ6_9ACTN